MQNYKFVTELQNWAKDILQLGELDCSLIDLLKIEICGQLKEFSSFRNSITFAVEVIEVIDLLLAHKENKLRFEHSEYRYLLIYTYNYIEFI